MSRLWLALLIAASAGLTTAYTCITPFAAFGVIAAMTLSRGHALAATVAVWLANQVVGFGALHYPWTAKTFAWGLALGGAAVLATLAARGMESRSGSLPSLVRACGAFVAAFAVHQLTLYAVAVFVLGGTGAFAPRIVGQVLLINAVAFVGLVGLRRLVEAAESFRRRRSAQTSPARFA